MVSSKCYEDRKDGRSDETFSRNLKDFHEREKGWAEALALDYTQRGRPCRIEDIGYDPDGNVIYGKLPGKNKGDKRLIFTDTDDDPVQFDVKTIPEWCIKFMTFKVKSLKSLIEHGTSVMVPRLSCHYIFPPDVLQSMIDKYPHKIYEKFSKKHPAIRPPQEDIDKLVADGKVTVTGWSPEAKNYIDLYEDVFTREKETDDD